MYTIEDVNFVRDMLYNGRDLRKEIDQELEDRLESIGLPNTGIAKFLFNTCDTCDTCDTIMVKNENYEFKIKDISGNIIEELTEELSNEQLTQLVDKLSEEQVAKIVGEAFKEFALQSVVETVEESFEEELIKDSSEELLEDPLEDLIKHIVEIQYKYEDTEENYNTSSMNFYSNIEVDVLDVHPDLLTRLKDGGMVF